MLFFEVFATINIGFVDLEGQTVKLNLMMLERLAFN